jgi:hypothetical protein
LIHKEDQNGSLKWKNEEMSSFEALDVFPGELGLKSFMASWMTK